MNKENKISLVAAILITINIMLGSGIFINPAPLSKIAGPFGFLGYLVSMIILIPIVLSIAELAKLHPASGGLYVYSEKYINPFIGFVSGWGYFLGKATAAGLISKIVAVFLKNRIVFLQNFSTLFLSFFLIFSLIFLNIIGVKIGGKIQYLITTAKAVPIATVIFTGITYFSLSHYQKINFTELIPQLIPISIFALMSFEIICSIGHLIENPKRNIKRSILYSFLIVVLITIIFQISIYAKLGINLANSKEPIYLFLLKIFQNHPIISKIINSFVIGSLFGGAFGSLIANSWNIFTLAKNKHLPFDKTLTKINKKNVAWVSLLFEGIIVCILLAISKKQIALQSMAVFCIVGSYMFSSISALIANINQSLNKKIIPTLAIISSIYIMWLSLKNLYFYGISFSFLSIFLIGIIIAFFRNQKIKIQ